MQKDLTSFNNIVYLCYIFCYFFGILHMQSTFDILHCRKVIDVWRLGIVDDKIISQAVVGQASPDTTDTWGELKDSGIERISSQD